MPLAAMKQIVPQGAASAGRRARLCASTKRRWHATATVDDNGHSADIGHGAVVIAAITSCTNTSNPSVMLAAGLLAKKAVEKGLDGQAAREDQPRPRLARRHRLLRQSRPRHSRSNKLGFHTVGYGCTTCIGNSGPLPEPIAKAVNEGRPGRRRPCSPATATSKAASIRW